MDFVTCVLILIAHGCPLQAIVAAFQIDERTVMDWQRRSGEHCHWVHEHLVQRTQDLIHVQADEIRVKTQGVLLWFAMAIMVSTRLWLGAAVSQHRDEGLIGELVARIRASALARLVQGSEAAAQALLAQSRGGTKLNTAFIQRLNANFFCEHKSLRFKLWVGERSCRWVQRTPAMATGITDHSWRVK